MSLKNETKYEDMVCVLEELHDYMPTISTTAIVDVSDTEQTELTYDDFHYILTGGDLLTAARARGSQRIRKCGERPKDRLEGILPVCEDWHAKMCLLGVSDLSVPLFVLYLVVTQLMHYDHNCYTKY